jgi:cell division protein FtsN
LLSEKTLGRGDEGEFELILGNRQLLSVFFIVVVLLGVFFTMGYIVGKNSVSATELAARKTDPVVVDPSRGEVTKPSPVTSPVKPDDLREIGTGANPPVERTTPERAVETPAVAPPKEAPREAPRETPREIKEPERPKPVEAKREPKPEVKPPVREAKPEPRPAPPAGAAPAPGNYLQVVATSKPDAEIIADVLRRKGFNSLVAPGPNEKIFRVVVGPLADSSTISKTRNELEAAAFQKPIIKKF